jgi:starch phosphorylase
VNGVAMRHGEVSRGMFPEYPIRSITNGIHAPTWAAPSFCALFDRYIRGWRRDALSLRYAVGIPARAIWWAHTRAKRALVYAVNRETNAGFDADVLTIGFARRATAYKRVTLVFSDVERLASIAKEVGPLQLVFAGKAHPNDPEGKALIRRVFEAREALRGRVGIAYLPNHDMESAKLLCAGSDLWLNTPVPPLEASGTSGMKAALNGVPSLSTVDGWWVEGHVEGVTGWAIGNDDGTSARSASDREREDAEALYEKLRREVLPCFYRQPQRYIQMMRYAIALNASFFNTQRMVLQYLHGAYAPLAGRELARGPE